MTKPRLIIISVCLAMAAGVWTFWSRSTEQRKQPVQVKQPSAVIPLHEVVAKYEGRTVVDRARQPLQRLPASVSYVNTPSPDWEQKLQTNLSQQAGNGLKDIKIRKERSLVWIRDEHGLLVESVVISMVNHQDVESSFRALIDSQTGKVLETWDRTIFDPINGQGEFRFKLDPRYSN